DYPGSRVRPPLRAPRRLRAARRPQGVHSKRRAGRHRDLRRPDAAVHEQGVLAGERLPELAARDSALRRHPWQPRYTLARRGGPEPGLRGAPTRAGAQLQVLAVPQAHLGRPEPFAGGAGSGRSGPEHGARHLARVAHQAVSGPRCDRARQARGYREGKVGLRGGGPGGGQARHDPPQPHPRRALRPPRPGEHRAGPPRLLGPRYGAHPLRPRPPGRRPHDREGRPRPRHLHRRHHLQPHQTRAGLLLQPRRDKRKQPPHHRPLLEGRRGLRALGRPGFPPAGPLPSHL
ncbi:MAG: 3',5'-cyclic-nucleotide phosphodiesterase, partial [uncultured Rubrobacteraceae bacterium]